MDLLFKNPPYFFKTYFNFSLPAFAISFVVILVILLVLCRKRFRSRAIRVLFAIPASLYGALLICITLNVNRSDTQGLILNPIENFRALFTEMRIHQLRGMQSNIFLFIPCGVFSALHFKQRKLLFSILFGAALSVLIEVLQFVFRRGYTETMDVICNTLGAAIGAATTIFILYIINQLQKRRS